MSLSDVCIHRPVGTSLMMAGIFLAGLAAYTQLPVSALPQVDYPTLVVSTFLPGANSETMASTVTTPLERQLGQIPALSQMTSVSSFGVSQITLQFDLDRSLDAAEQDVQAAIYAATNLLPRLLPTPPTYAKSNPADMPVLTLSVGSPTLALRQVDDHADAVLVQKISQVSGVGLVTLSGRQKSAIRVQVDPLALAGMDLTLEDVRRILTQANVHQPKGNLEGPRLSYALATDDQLYHAKDFQDIILSYKNNSPVRLKDVASVIEGVENNQLAGWADGEPAIILNVQKQPGANTLEVVDRIKAILPQLQESLPQDIHISILNDRTETVRASIQDVQWTLLLTMGLVVMVIFVFLHSLWATLISGMAVPLSLVATLGIMYLLDYSLDNLSLMALTISTGFVVDDAIVMIENISRYLQEGQNPLEAALKGARQMSFTILSLTLSLIAVLIPLLCMGGIIGRLFRAFAMTLSIAMASSAFVSLTLTPMMCAYLLRPHALSVHGFHGLSERFFNILLKYYDRSLLWVLHHPRLTLGVTLTTFFITLWLGIIIPKGFFPQQDTGLILGISEAPPDISFLHLVERQQAVEHMLRSDPDVAHIASFVGVDGTNLTGNSGRFSIVLKPRNQRRASIQKVIQRLESKLSYLPGIRLYLQPVQDLQMDSRLSRTLYQYTLESAHMSVLQTWVPKLLEHVHHHAALKDVTSDLHIEGLQAGLMLDRDTAARLGIAPQTIDDTLYDAFGQRQVSTVFTPTNPYRVILEVKPAYQVNPEALQNIYVRSLTGHATPLADFTSFHPSVIPLTINHQDQFPCVTLSFNVVEGKALGNAVEAIHQATHQIGLPDSIHTDFQGAAQAFHVALAHEPLLILAALLAVYIILGILYESYLHPITIISTLPSAGIGALLTLMLLGMDLSIVALIGLILLIGIVKKNAIMMIDFALATQRAQSTTSFAAIYEACLLRFRPILMTTLAALLGGLPLALGHGTGSELRRPLGATIVGGLILSQILTLYTTPVVYLYMDKLQCFLASRKGSGR